MSENPHLEAFLEILCNDSVVDLEKVSAMCCEAEWDKYFHSLKSYCSFSHSDINNVVEKVSFQTFFQ